MTQFELNKEYRDGSTRITFARRTAKCLFGVSGQKYLVGTWKDKNGNDVEYILPHGPHRGMMFAS